MISTRAARKPLLTIRPARGWQSVDLRELWQFRDLLITLAARDVKLRYRQTALGALWVVLQPLLGAGIFAFVFGRVAKLDSGGVPYFVLSYAGLLGWNIFAQTFTKASNSLVGNAHLVSKVYFPRLVLPLSTIFSTAVDFAVAMAVMVVLLASYRIAPGWGILLLPVWASLIGLLALGVSLGAGALMVSYRDMAYVIPVLTQMLLYASPVAYAMSAVQSGLRPLLLANPISPLLEAFRWSLIGKGELNTGWLVYAAACSVGLFLAGAACFRRMERRFADVI